MDRGTRIGVYQIDSLLGSGGMAEVYKAWHAGLHRYEALKVLPPQMTFDAGFVERFLAEARIAAKLNHANIVTIYGVSGPDEPQYYFSMELVDGGDLADMLEYRGRLPLDEALPILRQIGEALDYAHSCGVLHRDVKPGNVLLEQDRAGRQIPKVVDFGIARALEGGGNARLTKSGMIVGTPEYMSPEQGGSGPVVDHRADIYSLSVIAYEMICGRPPFCAESETSAISVIMRHIHDMPPPPMEYEPSLPVAVNDVLLKGLAKDPTNRFNSCAELTSALLCATASPPVPVQPVTTARRTTPQTLIGAAGTAFDDRSSLSTPLVSVLATISALAGIALVWMGLHRHPAPVIVGPTRQPPVIQPQTRILVESPRNTVPTHPFIKGPFIKGPAITPVVPPPGKPTVIPPPGKPTVIPPPGKPPVIPSPGKPPVIPSPGKPPVIPSPGKPPVIPSPGKPPVIPSPGKPPANPPPVRPVTTTPNRTASENARKQRALERERKRKALGDARKRQISGPTRKATTSAPPVTPPIRNGIFRPANSAAGPKGALAISFEILDRYHHSISSFDSTKIAINIRGRARYSESHSDLDSGGVYTFEGIPEGNATLTTQLFVRGVHVATREQKASVRADVTTQVKISMKAPVEGPATTHVIHPASVPRGHRIGQRWAEVASISVQARSNEWTYTGVMLRAGAPLQITADGDAAYGHDTWRGLTGEFIVDPDGRRRLNDIRIPKKMDPRSVCPGCPVGSLIGSVVDSEGRRSPAFLIGKRFSGPAPDYGVLCLLFNEDPDWCSDNTGSYYVHISAE